MKNLKRFMMAFVAMLTAFSMTVGSIAAEDAKTGSITINLGDYDANGVTFSAYRVMDAKANATHSERVTYTINETFKDFFKSKNSNNEMTDEEAYNYIKTNMTDLRSELESYISTNSTKVKAAGSVTIAEDTGKTAEIDNLPYGYYIVVPSTNEKGFVSNLTTVSKTATTNVSIKVDEPKVDKNIAGDEDSNDIKGAQVGDRIDFELNGYVPNTTGFETYYFALVDKMTKGLALDGINNDDLASSKPSFIDSVTIGGQELTYGRDYVVEKVTLKDGDASKYATAFRIVFKNIEKKNAGDKIVVKYHATLTKDGITVDHITNTAYPEYGKDSDTAEDGTPDTTETITGDVEILKYAKNGQNDDKSEVLAGATFNLFDNQEKTTPLKFSKDEETGVYTIDANGSADLVTGENGIIKIEGLDPEKTYYLVETVAPDGYVLATEDHEIIFTVNSSSGAGSASVETVKVEVPNTAGENLPETGGMGTVIFTIVGVALIGGVVLSFARRKKETE